MTKMSINLSEVSKTPKHVATNLGRAWSLSNAVIGIIYSVAIRTQWERKILACSSVVSHTYGGPSAITCKDSKHSGERKILACSSVVSHTYGGPSAITCKDSVRQAQFSF
jgi:hypothetical protein